jgi:tRNA(Ile)-lysidine synthase
MSLRAIFDDAMAACGPFEPRPHLAVAVSGGADSLALCLLARDWVERRHGKITALTIDHGLRQESAAEARDVAGLCADLRVDHRVLPWIGAKPRSAIQAQARAARYRLLTGWCGVNGVLHLLVGHHRDDQDETLMMRRARGSGADGLAGMAPIVEHASCRVLRPLLAVAKRDLRELLRVSDLRWIEDPSNRDLRFARARLRVEDALWNAI